MSARAICIVLGILMTVAFLFAWGLVAGGAEVPPRKERSQTPEDETE